LITIRGSPEITSYVEVVNDDGTVTEETSMKQSEMNLLQLALVMEGDDNNSLRLCRYILEQHKSVHPKTKEVTLGFDPRIITICS
jgi:hypothetical protein